MSVDPHAFAATRWTLVLASRGDTPEAKMALRDLCAGYYAPVVAFLRRDGRPEDAARDLAHAFFEEILTGGRFDAADPTRGRFRSYLLGALKHFLQHQRRKEHAARRGGEAVHLPLTSPTDTQPGFDVAQPPDPAADRAFDRHWALTVLARAIDTLRAEFDRVGKAEFFEKLRPWLTGDAAGPQSAAADAVGLSPGAAKVAIHRLRQRFRDAVKAEIAQTIGGDEAQVKDELNYLITVVS